MRRRIPATIVVAKSRSHQQPGPQVRLWEVCPPSQKSEFLAITAFSLANRPRPVVPSMWIPSVSSATLSNVSGWPALVVSDRFRIARYSGVIGGGKRDRTLQRLEDRGATVKPVGTSAFLRCCKESGMKSLKTIALAVVAAVGSFPTVAAAETRVVIVVGPSNHPPGSHEVAAGGRLMQWALENMANVSGVKAEVLYEWPKDRGVLDTASTIVFIGDTFPPQRMPDSTAILSDVGEIMKRGVGLVCVHYATGLRAQDVEPDGAHPLLRWMGGYFATGTPHHKSVAKVFQSVTIRPAAAEHPVSRGWREFIVDDEPYYNNYFGPDGNKPSANVTLFATAMLPPEAPNREAVAWGTERTDGGRGFAIVMPHFYKNWANEDLRRLILNGIVWTGKLDVPSGGVQTPTPDLTRFRPESVELKPRTSVGK